MSKIQIRGNCLHCAAQHAIVNGGIADHGFQIKHGWGQRLGSCKGGYKVPMQGHAKEAMDVVAYYGQLASEYAARVFVEPKAVTVRVRADGKYQNVDKPWADLDPRDQLRIAQKWEYDNDYQVKGLLAHQDYLLKAAAKHCDEPLVEVVMAPKVGIEVGSLIKIDGEICEVIEIKEKVCHGVSHTVNGQYLQHCFYKHPGNDKIYAWPKRFCRLAKAVGA